MGSANAWVPIGQGSISSLIATRILDVIAQEKMRPGDRLPPERELAAHLGVGRPSLREALGALKAQGRLDIRHGAGVFVADPETTRILRAAMYTEEINIEELFNMREVLEVSAAAWAAKNQDTVRLEAVTDAYEILTVTSLKTDVDWPHLQELDTAFHQRIFEAAGNRFLARTQGVLQELLSRGMETTLRVPGRLEKSRLDHRRILDAILAGNPAAARRAAKVHVDGARKAALGRLPSTLDSQQSST